MPLVSPGQQATQDCFTCCSLSDKPRNARFDGRAHDDNVGGRCRNSLPLTQITSSVHMPRKLPFASHATLKSPDDQGIIEDGVAVTNAVNVVPDLCNGSTK